jgi:hypothetical protein
MAAGATVQVSNAEGMEDEVSEGMAGVGMNSLRSEVSGFVGGGSAGWGKGPSARVVCSVATRNRRSARGPSVARQQVTEGCRQELRSIHDMGEAKNKRQNIERLWEGRRERRRACPNSTGCHRERKRRSTSSSPGHAVAPTTCKPSDTCILRRLALPADSPRC